ADLLPRRIVRRVNLRSGYAAVRRPSKHWLQRTRTVSLSFETLTAREALHLFEILSDMATAIWEAHEAEIGALAAEHYACRSIEAPPTTPAVTDSDVPV